MNFNYVFNYKNLYDAYRKCLLGVNWKGTVQNYKMHSISMLNKTLKQLQNEKFKSGEFFEFTIIERGKKREIKSVSIQERVVQRCLCDNLLVPILSKKLIYDNGACQEGKGCHFSIKRVKQKLTKFYRKYGTNGYILQFDFSKYFDNIDHDLLLGMLSKEIKDEKLMRLITRLVKDFGGNKGLGLGSQISQICALYYPNYLDHYFSTREGVFAYGRYMDDGYIIAKDKETLNECKKELKEIVEGRLKLKLNEKKTQISKLRKGFTFLKARISLLDTGKIIVKPCKKNIHKNRRKLRKFKKMLDNNELSFNNIYVSYKTTKGAYKHYHAYHTTKNYEKLFNELFGKEVKEFENNERN